MRTETYDFRKFMRGELAPTRAAAPAKTHWQKYGIVYKVVGSVVIIFVTGAFDINAFAATSAIDAPANNLYYQIVGVGKWIIIIKAAFDTIKSVSAGDFDGAKKHFFSYLIVYLLLLALPFGMDKIDEIFKQIRGGV